MKVLPMFVVACCAAATALHAQQAELPPPPGAMIDIGGRRLHLLCSGQGAPTVVLEAGASSFAIDWTLVQREVARTTRVCAYDRAGMGWSDPDTSSVGGSVTRDLEILLRTAGEKPPYVLVGASRGGLFVREYVIEHPEAVAGLVFVDPATEDRLFTMIDGRAMLIAMTTAGQLRATNPTRAVPVPRRRPQTGAPFDRLPADLYRTRIALDERLIASFPDTVSPEIVEASRESERALLARLMEQRNATAHALGDRPTIVLSRGTEPNADREAAHAAVARQSTSSRHTVVAGAGHEIHLFESGAVVQAIGDVVEAVRRRSPLRER